MPRRFQLELLEEGKKVMVSVLLISSCINLPCPLSYITDSVYMDFSNPLMIVFLRYPFGSVRTGLRAVLEKLYSPASLQSQRSYSCRRARSPEIEISPNLTPMYHSNFWTLLFLPWFQSLSEKKKKKKMSRLPAVCFIGTGCRYILLRVPVINYSASVVCT